MKEKRYSFPNFHTKQKHILRHHNAMCQHSFQHRATHKVLILSKAKVQEEAP